MNVCGLRWTLLHDALSAGLHNDDDVDCLSIAQDIQLVLTGFAERTSAVLKSNAEMAAAVTRLNQRRSGQTKPKSYGSHRMAAECRSDAA